MAALNEKLHHNGTKVWYRCDIGGEEKVALVAAAILKQRCAKAEWKSQRHGSPVFIRVIGVIRGLLCSRC